MSEFRSFQNLVKISLRKIAVTDRLPLIGLLLQQKYGKKVKDLTPTRRSGINLLGARKDAKFIIYKVQGNLWMSQYALDTGDGANQIGKDNSDKFISNNRAKGNR